MDAISATPNLLIRDSSFETGTTALNPLPANTTVQWKDAAALADVTAPNAQGALLMQSTGAGSYVRLDRSRILAPDQLYSVSVWVKSAVDGVDQTGVLTLEARNSTGVAENTAVPFTATDEWSLITVSHLVVDAGANRLRVQVSLDGGSGSQVLLDGFSLH
jgi:hypothetical protein